MKGKPENPEGKMVENIISDESSRSKRLLELCKKRDNSQKLIPVRLDRKTVFLVPEGTDIEQWKKNKIRMLNKYRDSDQP
ncbi:MAG: hypothetical protein LBL79_06520 [Prevotella sp.]|jgi:hypothetical protein|nr:hypothetical protein [Prevotella sp.]